MDKLKKDEAIKKIISLSKKGLKRVDILRELTSNYSYSRASFDNHYSEAKPQLEKFKKEQVKIVNKKLDEEVSTSIVPFIQDELQERGRDGTLKEFAGAMVDEKLKRILNLQSREEHIETLQNIIRECLTILTQGYMVRTVNVVGIGQVTTEKKNILLRIEDIKKLNDIIAGNIKLISDLMGWNKTEHTINNVIQTHVQASEVKQVISVEILDIKRNYSNTEFEND